MCTGGSLGTRLDAFGYTNIGHNEAVTIEWLEIFWSSWVIDFQSYVGMILFGALDNRIPLLDLDVSDMELFRDYNSYMNVEFGAVVDQLTKPMHCVAIKMMYI